MLEYFFWRPGRSIPSGHWTLLWLAYDCEKPGPGQLKPFHKRNWEEERFPSPWGDWLIVQHIVSSKKKSAIPGPRSKRVPRQGQIIESL